MNNSLLETYMPIKEDETVLDQIEGDAYNMSSNIILRILGFIIRIIAILTGSSRKILLTVTDKRIIVIEVNKLLWFIDGAVRSKSYTPRSIGTSGYELARSLIIFKSHYLEFNSGGVTVLVRAKSGKPKVMEMIASITALAEKVSK